MSLLENFPDSAARDADPTAVPLGPQSPSRHTSLYEDFADHHLVEEAYIQQANPQTRGPLEFPLKLNESPSDGDTRDLLTTVATDVVPSEYLSVSSTTIHGRCDTIPYDISSLDGAIHVIQHPLTPHIQRVGETLGPTFSLSLSWNWTPDSAPLYPSTTQWDLLPALYLGIDGPEPSLDAVVSQLMENITSIVPREYYTSITRSPPKDAIPSGLRGSARIFKISFGHGNASQTESSVYNASAESLPDIVSTYANQSNVDEDGIQLSITSPPYVDAIDYATFATGDDDDNWGPSHSREEPVNADLDTRLSQWKDLQQGIFEEVLAATNDGGYLAVVIGHIKTDDGQWLALPHEFATLLTDIGWNFHERIIWNKTTNGSPRFGTTVQNPHATYYYPNQLHEEILIFRKGDIVRQPGTEEELSMSTLMKQEIANNIWHVPPVPHNKNIEHPAPFPEELVHRLTVLYSHRGDIVADPMAGSGTTLAVADQLGRLAIGTEIQPFFVTEARSRLYDDEYERNDPLLPEYESIPSDSPDARLTEPVNRDSTPEQKSTESDRISSDQSNLDEFDS